jgi:hypothetical protein
LDDPQPLRLPFARGWQFPIIARLARSHFLSAKRKAHVLFTPNQRKRKSIRLECNAARLCARLFRLSQKAGHEMILIFPMSIFASKNLR